MEKEIVNEKYTGGVYCSNCKKKEEPEIKKGTTVKQWLNDNLICPNCGCDRRENRMGHNKR